MRQFNLPDLATLDHLQEKRNGGSNSQSNLVVACFECNHDRDVRGLDWHTYKAMKGQEL